MLTRRQSLYVLTGAVATYFGSRVPIFGSSTAPSVLTPEQEEGPFYIPDEHIRKDIRESKPGLPLELSIALVEVTSGKPVTGAAVDIWHCDAGGVYSGFAKLAHMGPPPGGTDGGPDGFPDDDHHDHPMGPPPDGFGGHADGGHGGPGGPPHMGPTDTSRFLRGVQITDAKGIANFTTIYPGWYAGREIHIHLKVHLAGAAQESTYSGGHVCHTGQIFFPDTVNVAVSRTIPYSTSATPRTTKTTDHVYRGQHGDQSLATVRLLPSTGYSAQVTLAVDPAATPTGRV